MQIKRRVLGDGHTDYADTMYHLGMVSSLLNLLFVIHPSVIFTVVLNLPH